MSYTTFAKITAKYALMHTKYVIQKQRIRPSKLSLYVEIHKQYLWLDWLKPVFIDYFACRIRGYLYETRLFSQIHIV